MEVVLSNTILASEEELGDAETGELPNSISFAFIQAESDGDPSPYSGNTPVITTNINGMKQTFRGTTAIFSPSNVRLPVVITVSQTSAEMFVNGEHVVAAFNYGTLPYTTAFWHLVHRTYYSGRGHDAAAPNDTHMPVMGLQVIHWDTIQFDGPAGAYHPVTKAYIQPGCNPMVNIGPTEMDDAPSCAVVSETTIEIPDDLTDVRSVRMLMNGPTVTPTTATVNGHPIQIPTTPSRLAYLGLSALSTVDLPVIGSGRAPTSSVSATAAVTRRWSWRWYTTGNPNNRRRGPRQCRW